MGSYQRRAKRVLGLRSVRQAHGGMVTFVQPFDSSLRLSPHGHVLALDGVYVRNQDGALLFRALPEPTQSEVHEVAARTAARIERVLGKLGRYLDEPAGSDAHDELAHKEPVLSACYKAAVRGQQLLGLEPGQPVVRVLGLPRVRRDTSLVVCEVRGVNAHADRVVDGRGRAQLERLCRTLVCRHSARRGPTVCNEALCSRCRRRHNRRATRATLGPPFAAGMLGNGGTDETDRIDSGRPRCRVWLRGIGEHATE